MGIPKYDGHGSDPYKPPDYVLPKQGKEDLDVSIGKYLHKDTANLAKEYLIDEEFFSKKFGFGKKDIEEITVGQAQSKDPSVAHEITRRIKVMKDGRALVIAYTEVLLDLKQGGFAAEFHKNFLEYFSEESPLSGFLHNYTLNKEMEKHIVSHLLDIIKHYSSNKSFIVEVFIKDFKEQALNSKNERLAEIATNLEVLFSLKRDLEKGFKIENFLEKVGEKGPEKGPIVKLLDHNRIYLPLIIDMIPMSALFVSLPKLIEADLGVNDNPYLKGELVYYVLQRLDKKRYMEVALTLDFIWKSSERVANLNLQALSARKEELRIAKEKFLGKISVNYTDPLQDMPEHKPELSLKYRLIIENFKNLDQYMPILDQAVNNEKMKQFQRESYMAIIESFKQELKLCVADNPDSEFIWKKAIDYWAGENNKYPTTDLFIKVLMEYKVPLDISIYNYFLEKIPANRSISSLIPLFVGQLRQQNEPDEPALQSRLHSQLDNAIHEFNKDPTNVNTLELILAVLKEIKMISLEMRGVLSQISETYGGEPRLYENANTRKIKALAEDIKAELKKKELDSSFL